jgi:hypothetical protein
MDSGTRNELRLMVIGCRKTLESSLAEILEGHYGIDTKGQQSELSALGHLNSTDKVFRDELVSQLNHIIASGFKPKDAVSQLVREVAFTHFNRLCAYKLLEQRGHIRETVSRGIESNGFLRYLAENKDEYSLFSTGKQDVAYRHFLIWQGSTLSDEIGVLFSPYDPANRLFPPYRVIETVLSEINKESLKDIWKSDETIGWIYQYFTPKELRDIARSESQAPRKSYELAFRNQFFTPRYVVQFLTENTLGRIWYEMRQGKTAIATMCEYMVRYPHEIFLKSGESFPTQSETAIEKSREELLNQPWYIQYRERKDPRDFRVMDPACGSGHFVLYCFDLFEEIYREAWEDPQGVPFSESGKTIRHDYPDFKEFQKAIPGLILRHNLHGIDIDLRATQIATLALWLRAQRSYHELGIPREQRPQITRSNIVCAEPMPGEKELLEEFIATLNPPVLGGLVRTAFEKMKLAGEAGSLLKIEEEIAQSIASAKEQWLSRPKNVQLTLFPKDKKSQWQTSLYNVSGISDASFWDIAEQKVLEALHAYATQVSDGSNYCRAIFAEDAARGFAFIELCGKKYDVVLMNPPFGAASLPSKKYIDESYAPSKNDVYAAFVDRWAKNLTPHGRMGAITSRTGLFLVTFQRWREEILLKIAKPQVVADLGASVLDKALVDTVAYCLERESYQNTACFFNLKNDENKSGSLIEKIQELHRDKFPIETFLLDVRVFKKIPNCPFPYWITKSIREIFKKFPQFENSDRIAQHGLSTKNDFRFIRTWWEIEKNKEGNSIENTTEGKYWIPLAKGGEFSRFYTDIHLVVNWKNNGGIIEEYVLKKYPYLNNNAEWILHRECRYFSPGLNWSRSTVKGLSVRILPRGILFSDKGPSAFLLNDNLGDLRILLAIMNSKIFEYLVFLRHGLRAWEVGLVQSTPIPIFTSQIKYMEDLATNCYYLKRTLEKTNENSYYFIGAQESISSVHSLNEWVDLNYKMSESTEKKISENLGLIDEIAYNLYQLSAEDRQIIEESLKSSIIDEAPNDSEKNENIIDNSSLISGLISYYIGSLFGRWDIRYATGEKQPPELPDPFAPLPACSPGMLQGEDGLPLLEAPPGYPLRIDDDGILVDDEYHPEDIITRLREVLALLWGDKADSIEQETCEILSVKSLREYFRKPSAGGFWDSHMKRYSKSRRKAPIYWLLQSSKKNYALWIYYHRLTPDTLFRALERYVKPKIQMEENRLAEMQSELKKAGTGGAAVKKLEKAVEKQESFVGELSDFKEKLERAASLFLEPDLDDGVVLTIAPLHELVPWKEAGAYWDELLEGKYEWSSIGKQLREKGMVK